MGGRGIFLSLLAVVLAAVALLAAPARPGR